MRLTTSEVKSILTRTSGFLKTVTSHSLQPYRGCALGNSLCGVGCYVQHNVYLTLGERWGSFVEARVNAAASYREQYERERNWARKSRGRFGIFMSSSTEPFQPMEREYRITRGVLEAMVDLPPDFLIVQSHSHHVADYLDLYPELGRRCALRFHISIESDRDRLGDLPPAASSVEKRFEAAAALKRAGMRVVITVAPLLPMDDPEGFFARVAEAADGVVIDHFIGGDGSKVAKDDPESGGWRTRRTELPRAMAGVVEDSVTLGYRDRMVEIASRYMPGRVGVGVDGFAGRMGVEPRGVERGAN